MAFNPRPRPRLEETMKTKLAAAGIRGAPAFAQANTLNAAKKAA